MNRQKSFENERPTLYLVATPIGNLDEMTYRSINTLKNVKYIAAEDTRNTVKLLNHYVHIMVVRFLILFFLYTFLLLIRHVNLYSF